jgi:hypothetical protein
VGRYAFTIHSHLDAALFSGAAAFEIRIGEANTSTAKLLTKGTGLGDSVWTKGARSPRSERMLYFVRATSTQANAAELEDAIVPFKKSGPGAEAN